MKPSPLMAGVLFVATALRASPAQAAESSLALRFGSCLSDSQAAIQEVVSLELERSVELLDDSHGWQAGAFVGVTVTCADQSVSIRYANADGERRRSLDVSDVSDKALARTVALAIVELLETPQPSKPLPPPPSPPQVERLRFVPAAAASGSVTVLGIARFFPRTSDLTWGGRVRSKLPRGTRSAALFGVGIEHGNARRAAGKVEISAAFAELGLTRDFVHTGRFDSAIEAVVEGGYVLLKGEPETVSLTQGQRLRGAWADIQLALAPRLQLGSALKLSSRLGAGWMLLAPTATSDSTVLQVWQGASFSANLGLSVVL